MYNKRNFNSALDSIRGVMLLHTCLLFLIISGCKKEGLSEADKLAERLSSSSMVSYVQKGAMVTFNGTKYNFVTSYVGVPITLKEAVKNADTIIANVDTSFVSTYNSVYGERNPMIPSNAFKISNNGIFPLQIGNTQAKDSLYITLNDARMLKNNATYLVPISLKSKHGALMSYSLFFIKITVSVGELKSRMDFANTWSRDTAPYWRSGSLFLQYLPESDPKGVMIGPDSVRFSVTLNTPFNPSNVKVDAMVTVDDSTINAFSKKAGTTYRAFPADTYELRRSSVQVLSKSLKSRDSLSLVIKNKQKFNRFTWYLLGLKIRKAADNPLGVPPVANDSARAFVSFFIL